MSYAQDVSNALKLFNSGQYEKAAVEFEGAIPEIEKQYGTNDTLIYSKLLLYTALSYEGNHQYDFAENYYLKSISVYKRINGINSEMFAGICNNLAALYSSTGKFNEAEPLYIEAKKVRENILGKKHPDYAQSCNNLGMLYKQIGMYTKAESLLLEAVKIKEEITGIENEAYARTVHNLAALYSEIGFYDISEELFLKSLQIYEHIFGKDHPEYASSVNGLASLYKKKGNYKEAEKLYLEAKKIRSHSLGMNHPLYAVSCNDLAGFYLVTGNFEKAEALYIEAKTIYINRYGQLHPEYATSCNNLAALYFVMQKNQETEQMYLESISVYKNTYGVNNPAYAKACNNLGLLYLNIGKFDDAEAFFEKAKSIREQVLGSGHPEYAESCNNLATLYEVKGMFEKSEQLYIEAKEIYKRTFGLNHLVHLNITNNLAHLYEIYNKREKAELYYIEANRILKVLLIESAVYMSETEREKFINSKAKYYFEGFNSFYLKKDTQKDKLSGFAFDNSLLLKGQLLKSLSAFRKAAVESKDSTIICLYNEYIETGKILVEQNALPLLKRRSDITQITDEYNNLEKEILSRLSVKNGNNLQIRTNSWQEIRNTLKDGEAVVEFLHFNYKAGGRRTDSIFYYALILKKDETFPVSVFLFEENQVQSILNRNDLYIEYEYIKTLYDKNSPKADNLYNLIWKPLQNHLTGIHTIHISPSGILNRIAFDAVPTGTDGIVSDKYKIIYRLNSGELLNKTSFYTKDISSAAIFGGIDYDYNFNDRSSFEKEKPDVFEYENIDKLDSITRNFFWSYLPGSYDEMMDINQLFEKKSIKIKSYFDKKASEDVFKFLQNDAPDVIHLSTHGYYFSKDEIGYYDNTMAENGFDFVFSQNPLLRSGLLLAGGNYSFQGNLLPVGVEDGILTALEISQMNLLKTKLVVLSACQTGLGDLKGNEGVYGLQRALKMAGVDYMVISLWQVPDEATKELMVKFYEYWFSGLEIRDAFKKAQDHLKEEYKNVPGSAYAWAAFVLIN